MHVKDALDTRRAYRSLEKTEISEELIRDLAGSAQLAASCYNRQPWRFVFVHNPGMLEALHGALSKGNEWARFASMIIAVVSRQDFDCVTKGREYYLFDTGMATASLILRATERDLVAHPIAGFDEDKAKEILNIPGDMRLITLVIVGKHSETINPILSENQAESEKERPKRFPFDQFAFMNKYTGSAEPQS